MAPGKRRRAPRGLTAAQKGRSIGGKRRGAAKKVSARRKGPAGSQKYRNAAKRAFEVFDQQIDPLWDCLTNECREFARGFNEEMGADQLRVESHPAGLMVRLTTDGAEAFFAVDRTDRHVSVTMRRGCTDVGSCITDEAPIGLAIRDGRLGFLLGGGAITEEALAVKILTDLLEADSPQSSR